MLIRSRKWVTGGFISALALMMFGGGYLALFHTALPLRVLASLVSQDDRINVEGVSGSVAKGFHVDRVEIKDAKRPPAEIEDLSFRYGGAGWGKEDHVVIEDARVGKATVYVNMNPVVPRLPVSLPEEANLIASPPTASQSPAASPGSSISMLQIKRLFLDRLVVRDAANAFEITLPKIEWTGFQIEKGRISPGSVTSTSEELDLQTLPGESIQIDGELVAFQKRVLAQIKPGLHPALRAIINAEIDLSLDLQGLAVVRVRAFENALEAFHSSKHSGYVRCKNLDLAHFIDPKPFVLPNRIELDVSYAADLRNRVHSVDLKSGSFQLGAVDFEIEPQNILFNERNIGEAVVVRASGKDQEREYAYTLAISASDKPLLQTITSVPPLPPEEVLARVLYGTPLAKLSEQQLAELKRQLPRYTQIASKGRRAFPSH